MKYLRLKGYFFLLFVVLLQGAVSKSHAEEVKLDFKKLDQQLHSIITNKSSSDEDLLKAISHLRPVTEPPEFWTKIANDSSYNVEHRRRAVMSLFRRHCWENTVKGLGEKLKPANWLSDADISSFDTISVENRQEPMWEMRGKDSIFVIKPFPGSRPSACIYIKVGDKMSLEEFSRLIRRDRVESLRLTSDRLILECFIGDDYEKWLHSQR
jgi:hypothetical protein